MRVEHMKRYCDRFSIRKCILKTMNFNTEFGDISNIDKLSETIKLITQKGTTAHVFAENAYLTLSAKITF